MYNKTWLKPTLDRLFSLEVTCTHSIRENLPGLVSINSLFKRDYTISTWNGTFLTRTCSIPTLILIVSKTPQIHFQTNLRVASLKQIVYYEKFEIFLTNFVHFCLFIGLVQKPPRQMPSASQTTTPTFR